jgi:hypothetical protein
MPRGMVALLAAVAAGLPVLATLAHGALLWVTAAEVAGAAWFVAYVTTTPGSTGSAIFKKKSLCVEDRDRLLRRRHRHIPRQPEFVLVTTTPAEDHRSSLRDALDALS